MRPVTPVFSSNASAHQFQKNLGGPPVSQHFLAGNVALSGKALSATAPWTVTGGERAPRRSTSGPGRLLSRLTNPPSPDNATRSTLGSAASSRKARGTLSERSRQAARIQHGRGDIDHVVSQRVVRAYPERTDLVFPTDLVRDASRQIVGRRALGSHSPTRGQGATIRASTTP